MKPTSANIPVQDISFSLKKAPNSGSEMEKNTDYFVCVDDLKGGFWKIKNLSYTKESENCIRLNSGNFVKSGKIQYATRMGNGYTFHLLVGMKYIDLRGQKHLLGYNKEYKFTHYGKIIYYDSLRYEEMNEVLAVDKYKVTECEFVQTLWDSIPSELGREPFYLQYSDNNLFWINKKKSMIKGGFCNAHDSAAVRVYLHHAFVYANNRSLRTDYSLYIASKSAIFFLIVVALKKTAAFG